MIRGLDNPWDFSQQVNEPRMNVWESSLFTVWYGLVLENGKNMSLSEISPSPSFSARARGEWLLHGVSGGRSTGETQGDRWLIIIVRIEDSSVGPLSGLFLSLSVQGWDGTDGSKQDLGSHLNGWNTETLAWHSSANARAIVVVGVGATKRIEDGTFGSRGGIRTRRTWLMVTLGTKIWRAGPTAFGAIVIVVIIIVVVEVIIVVVIVPRHDEKFGLEGSRSHF